MDAQERELALVRRELDQSKTGAAAASDVANASLAKVTQALAAERSQAGVLARDLAEARRSTDALRASAEVAASARCGPIQSRQRADAAARQARKTLDRERKSGSTLLRNVEAAGGDRDKSQIDRMSKPRRAERKPQRPTTSKSDGRKVTRVVTIMLPKALLPARPPARGFRR